MPNFGRGKRARAKREGQWVKLGGVFKCLDKGEWWQEWKWRGWVWVRFVRFCKNFAISTRSMRRCGPLMTIHAKALFVAVAKLLCVCAGVIFQDPNSTQA